MLTLFSTPPAWGLPSFSPFCLKLDAYLRMAGIPYTARTGDMRKSPKGKLPWIDDDGALLGDSSAIIDYLKKKHGDPLDARLSRDERARLHTLQRMIEEHTYFALAFLRWSSEAAKPHLRAAFSKILPPLVGGLIMGLIRKDVLKSAKSQGIGRHSHAEIIDRLRLDLEAVSLSLGESPYFFGDEPTSLDAILYGFLANMLETPWDAPEKAVAEEFPNLLDHCARVKARYFAEPA